MNQSFENKSKLRVYDPATYEMSAKLMDYKSLMLFIEEIVDYSMRQNNLLNWIPPMNLEFLRLQHANVRFFDDRIGEAIGHRCTEINAVNLAQRHGFDENRWLSLIQNPEEARQQMIWHLGLMLTHAYVPINMAAFQMFSFGCYVARVAMKRAQNGLANEVIQALVHTCCTYFPNEQQYTQYLSGAVRFNLEHRCIEA